MGNVNISEQLSTDDRNSASPHAATAACGEFLQVGYISAWTCPMELKECEICNCSSRLPGNWHVDFTLPHKYQRDKHSCGRTRQFVVDFKEIIPSKHVCYYHKHRTRSCNSRIPKGSKIFLLFLPSLWFQVTVTKQPSATWLSFMWGKPFYFENSPPPPVQFIY